LRTRPIPFVEAYVERQIGRGVKGFGSVGPPLLTLLTTYDKGSLQKILLYANMLYPYVKKCLERAFIEETEKRLEPVISSITSNYGFEGIKLEKKKDETICYVRLKRPPGDLGRLASDIRREIRSRFPDLIRLRLRIWIEKA
jgi:hypothetical protein